MSHWLAYWLGLTNGAGKPYLFWSGFGSDLGEAAIVGGLVTMVRHKNCYVRSCWRIGHTDPEHGHPACRKHHSQAHKL